MRITATMLISSLSKPLNYRTGSGSDLAVWLPLNQKALKTQFESVAAARSLPLPVL